MAYTDKAEFQIPRHIVQKGGVNIQAITDNITLDYDDGTYHHLTLTAVSPKTVILPSPKNGICLFIRNDAASNQNLAVNEPVGGATLVTLNSTGEGALFVSDGSAWKYILKGT
tara:strand:+ start:828 stop:1166 length:339 start_codon:yes stop_codon:yes gene_type:complete